MSFHNHCELCHGVGSKIERLHFGDNKHYLAYCRKCDLFFIDPQIKLTKGYLSKYYDSTPNPVYENMYKEFTDKHKHAEVKRAYQRQIEFLDKFTPRKGRLLDVGCNHGTYLYISQQLGWEAYGIEISKHWANKAKKLLNNKAKIYIGKFEDYDLPHNYFHVVHLRHLIEHLENPLVFLNRTFEILRPGGVALIETPNSRSLANNALSLIARIKQLPRRHFTPVEPPFHLFGYSKKSIRILAKQAGFDIALCSTTAIGDRVWYAKNNKISKRDFYGSGYQFMIPIHKISKYIGKGDNLLVVLKKPIDEHS